MNLIRTKRALVASAAAACWFVASGGASAQATQLENGFRNTFSEQGPPPTPPPGVRGPATSNQFNNGTAFGGWTATLIRDGAGNVIAGTPNLDINGKPEPGPGGTLVWPSTPRDLDGNLASDGRQLKDARFGRPVVLRQVTQPLGSILARPDRQPNGDPIPPGDPNFYLPEPWNSIDGTDETPNRTISGSPVTKGRFYWSPHAQKVFATEPGLITVIWKLRTPVNLGTPDAPENFVTRAVAVSGSPAKPTRRLFWTERGFGGPVVRVPNQRVGDVNVVYTEAFPESVPVGQDYQTLFDPPVDPDVTLPPERRTLWQDEHDGAIHAYNREGRVFVELLGDLQEPERIYREHLGFEIVDVIKEVRPEEVRVAIGDRVHPVDEADLTAEEEALVPSIVAGAGLQSDPYLFEHLTLGGTQTELYAIRATSPLIVVDRNGDGLINELDEQQSNEVLIYWKEEGEAQLLWPRRYVGYIFKWPEEYLASHSESDLRGLYSIYARPEDAGDAEATGVQLNSADNPVLTYQDDVTRQHAQVTAQNVFYTVPGTGNRSLIRYSDGDDIWFERVYSIDNSDFDDYATTTAAVIGTRIDPPTGAEDLVGYIRQTSGDAFNAGAYIDPFVDGFDAAGTGAIIPVNALPGNDVLEVWWYQKNQPNSDTFTSNAWPSYVERYQLAWPVTDPDDAELYDEIVLARNDGSGELGIAASGSIYRQPDPNSPGHNPNEEHALMSGGVAWALRDDLNTATSSEPFVLVDYTAEDGRPAMAIRRVVRENLTHTFNYEANVGVILQSPMPLPLLPPPFVNDDVKNTEVGVATDVPTNFASNEEGFEHYENFTFNDRKGATWIYRGPHGDGVNVGSVTDPTKTFRMHYFYATLADFDFPIEVAAPAEGTIIPYLTDAPITGAIENETPAEITFTPIWPSDAPVLNIAETLGLPKRGLPAVRGQTSAETLYQQSIADDFATKVPSGVLHDPTRAKQFAMTEAELSAMGAIDTSPYQGKTYFPGLPPHLSQRLFYDPNIRELGALVFIGEFVDALLGEDYFLLNVMSAKDVADAKALNAASADWAGAIDGLTTNTGTEIGVNAVAAIDSDDTPVDSYAFTANGGGTGFVAMIAGNGEASPEGEPVAVEIFRVEAPLYSGELKIIASANPLDEKLTLRHSGDFAGDPADFEFEWVSAQPVGGFPPPNPGTAPWLAVPTDAPLHTVEGASITTLTDNYFAMRYRAKPGRPAHTATGGAWSDWTMPNLAEGWIKRALGGINPFEQRITDLFNNSVNTDVSLLTQAGARWEGNIALNLENIDDFGLIEIYETILNRGKDLSIEGAPPLNVPAANDALLLAAGYLNDLYMLLGNEAFADAANPTIAFDTDGLDFGEFNTALFAFKGQLGNVLEEELALLRGRDDNLQPGVRLTPVYNRLVWNFTGGINSGEPIYSLNYNILDNDVSGAADAADAAVQYPQGHGDAYGHYLTALKGYYTLLHNDHFAWTPRIEAVSVLGQPVSIDYQDERKFATAAAALARTAAQTLDLTYREEFTADETAGWSHLEEAETNTNTGVTRHWGTDQWATRAGLGSYFHWVTANSILPEEDAVNTGIEKVDRTTVPELDELASRGADIQLTLDNADNRLNPLGLAKGALSFDISPDEIDNGKTHYEQVYDRAIGAMENAVFAFDNAKRSTGFLRAQTNSVADQRAAIEEQEQAFENELIEIYGTPYADDIGPGKTYPQGYAGPDLVHFPYIDAVELFDDPTSAQSYDLIATAALEFDGDPPATLNIDDTVTLSLTANGEPIKPEAWEGRRAHPGALQTAVSDLMLARQQLRRSTEDYSQLDKEVQELLDVYIAIVTAHSLSGTSTTEANEALHSLEAVQIAARTIASASTFAAWTANDLAAGGAEAFPGTFGFSNDATSVPRSFAKLGGAGAAAVLRAEAVFQDTIAEVIEREINDLNRQLQVDLDQHQWTAENRQLTSNLQQALNDLLERQRDVNTGLRNLDQAQRNLQALKARGITIQTERETFRKRAAAIIQGYRTRDLAFRVFRDEALEKYKTLYDLAARYTFLAARAYDYETGLLDGSGSSAAAAFYDGIVQSRALGVVDNGVPQFTASTTGDPGLAGVLAQMQGDWSVAKTRLGFNNPDRYRTTFSLREENFRIIPGEAGDGAWRDKLASFTSDNILDDPDVRRYCMQIATEDGLPVPGLVIPFQTTITRGHNFFGHPSAAGDHDFSPTSFATKIRASGIAFDGYIGMDDPTSNGGAVAGAGGQSPPDPDLGFLDPDALKATPYIYLIPAGVDSMRSPPLGDTSTVRTWTVDDQAIPLPFNIGNTDFSDNSSFLSGDSLSEDPFQIRKHQAFRAVPGGTVFSSAPGFTNSRLIGRSVWNSNWKIVIPGDTLLNNPEVGLEIFKETVTDIELFLETYSYSGN